MWCIFITLQLLVPYISIVFHPHLHELAYSVVKCPSLQLKPCRSSGYWFSPRKYVACCKWNLPYGPQLPLSCDQQYCFLLFSLLLVKAAFSSLQTLGSEPVTSFLHASVFCGAREKARHTIFLCRWTQPLLPKSPPSSPRRCLCFSVSIRELLEWVCSMLGLSFLCPCPALVPPAPLLSPQHHSWAAGLPLTADRKQGSWANPASCLSWELSTTPMPSASSSVVERCGWGGRT